MPRLVRRQANAQAGAQGGVLVVGQRIEAITQRIHSLRGAVERHVRQDHAEFIAAISPRLVGAAQVLAQYLAELT